MSHRYWANFSTQYLWLKPIFLDPDSNPITHTTWQTSSASTNINPKMKDRRFFDGLQKWGDFHYFFKIHTQEPGPVLGNLDLNRLLVWDPYLGSWTRTWELWIWPVFVYVLKFLSATLLKILSYFVLCLINVLDLISMPIIDALLLCHVSWIIGFESGLKKIGFS